MKPCPACSAKVKDDAALQCPECGGQWTAEGEWLGDVIEPAPVFVAPAGAAALPAPRLATAGFVCGIIAVVGFWVPILGIVAAILAVVLSANGYGAAKAANAGVSQAKAGMSLGFVGMALSVLLLVLDLTVWN